MEKSDIMTDVLTILHRFAPEVDIQSVKPNQPLREQFEIDSLDFANFIIRIHEKIGVDIPETDYGRLKTLDDTAQYIMSALEKQEPKT